MAIQFTESIPATRTGVVICGCGGEISNFLDTQKLQKRVSALPGVTFTSSEPYPCSKDGQERLKKAILEQKLDRVLIAGCTPRAVEKLFKGVARSTGLSAGLIEIADIREQCVYVHINLPDIASEKALDQIAMGIKRLQSIQPPQVLTSVIHPSVAIFGTSLEGQILAISLARSGKQVILIDEDPEVESKGNPLQSGADEMLRDLQKERQVHGMLTPHLKARVLQIEEALATIKSRSCRIERKHRFKLVSSSLPVQRILLLWTKNGLAIMTG